jgi:predicted HicB family RNase H-like nuclease
VDDAILKYRNYTARVRFSDEDGCYVGKVLGIDDQIVFDGASLDAARSAFEADVDDYIRYCREKGREPQAPTPSASANNRAG